MSTFLGLFSWQDIQGYELFSFRASTPKQLEHKIKNMTQAAFVLASNHFKKSFSVKPCVWLRMKNRIFQICISVDRKKKPLTRKLFYISIFTSNHFRTELQTCKERERERERETVSKNRPSSSPTTHTPPVSSIAAPRQSSKDQLQHHSILPPPCDLAFTSTARSRLQIKPSRLSLFLLLSI